MIGKHCGQEPSLLKMHSKGISAQTTARGPLADAPAKPLNLKKLSREASGMSGEPPHQQAERRQRQHPTKSAACMAWGRGGWNYMDWALSSSQMRRASQIPTKYTHPREVPGCLKHVTRVIVMREEAEGLAGMEPD